ncbi:hypothetical protein [Sphingomonas sp.]|jgi:hypothetical protein|uniref:hypothetical protein n=1 Tax=Sphingomonas sp. TaxID=28214 RepID=UPI0035C7DE78
MMNRLMMGLLLAACAALASRGGGGVTSAAPPSTSPTPTFTASSVHHILFVGDSLTHGRYTPVRSFNSGGSESDTTGSAYVTDENYGQTGNRAEREPGPWGGIPGIFAQLASEAGLTYDVHIEAISKTSLAKNYEAASTIIDQPKWNAVVLQEISARPLPASLTGNASGRPATFCSSVQTIEAGIHAVAPTADVYLYETWPSGATAQQLSGSTTASDFPARYAAKLEAIRAAYHASYFGAAQKDGRIAGVAPVGDAWAAAWAANVANDNPYSSTSPLPLLWYGMNARNDPAISKPDYLHPSVYGAYLSGLVLFQQITGVDPRSLGAGEGVATRLGISPSVAVRLQQVAHDAVIAGAAAKVARGSGCS